MGAERARWLRRALRRGGRVGGGGPLPGGWCGGSRVRGRTWTRSGSIPADWNIATWFWMELPDGSVVSTAASAAGAERTEAGGARLRRGVSAAAPAGARHGTESREGGGRAAGIEGGSKAGGRAPLL